MPNTYENAKGKHKQIKNRGNPKCWWGHRQLGPSLISDGNATWRSRAGRKFGSVSYS